MSSLLEDKKQGHSDHFDRIDLLELFLETFGKDRIKALLGEREFIGALWITYLKEQEIPYVFRLKENGQKIANSIFGVHFARTFDYSPLDGQKPDNAVNSSLE